MRLFYDFALDPHDCKSFFQSALNFSQAQGVMAFFAPKPVFAVVMAASPFFQACQGNNNINIILTNIYLTTYSTLPIIPLDSNKESLSAESTIRTASSWFLLLQTKIALVPAASFRIITL